jgi:hypothetical protein
VRDCDTKPFAESAPASRIGPAVHHVENDGRKLQAKADHEFHPISERSSAQDRW